MGNVLSKTVHDLVKSRNFWLISSFKTDLRSMAKSSNSIKPNLSQHNTKVILSLAPY